MSANRFTKFILETNIIQHLTSRLPFNIFLITVLEFPFQSCNASKCEHCMYI